MRQAISLFLIIFFFAPFVAQSEVSELKDIHLARISTDYVRKTYDLAVQVNAGDEVVNIKTRNNKKNKIKLYGRDVLSEEITLVKAAGISLVTLRCLEFEPKTGCKITIEYPYNITYGNFDKFHAELRKKDGQWGLYSKGKRFDQLHLVSKTVFGLLIGINRIDLR